jgi:uncharacterized protein YciW
LVRDIIDAYEQRANDEPHKENRRNQERKNDERREDDRLKTIAAQANPSL